MGKQYELNNGRISLVVDQDGQILALANLSTGHDYVSMPSCAPWRAFYRQGNAIDLEIAPQEQKAEISLDDQTLTWRYAALIAHEAQDHNKRTIQVKLKISVTLNEASLNWQAEIENDEEGIEITEIWLPWLYGIGDLGLGRTADALYWPEAAGRRIQNPYAELATAWENDDDPSRARAYPWFRLTYPWPASMQWFTLNNGLEGLYVGSHDQTLMTTCLNVMAHKDEALSASVIKYPFVKTGEHWCSEPVVVCLYQGDWHHAAHIYRAWMDTWMTLPTPPEWIRRAPGWVKPFLKDQSWHIRGVYADFPAMLQRAQNVGMNILHCFGWVAQGFDNRYPHYSPDEQLGGEDGLRSALQEITQAGGKMILYTQGQLIDPTTEFYRTKGHRIVAKDIWGYEYREQYAFFNEGSLLQTMRNKYFGIACPSAPGWMEQLDTQFDLIRGLGAQGMLFDQMGGRPPYICFSTEHDHDKPSLAAGPGKVKNMRHLREKIKADNADFAFVIELATDIYCQYADIVHSHGIGFWHQPQSFGELFRYTFPEPAITNRADVQDGRRKHFGYGFALGLRFDANTSDTEDADIAAYLGRLCALRNAYPELLLEGRFVDNEGFVCDNSQVSAHGFLTGDRLAITLWNPSDTPQTFRIVAPGYALETAAWQDPALSGPDHAILPGDIAIQIWRKGAD